MSVMHEGFLAHRQLRFLKLAAWVCAASLAAYLWHDPAGGPSGDTWLGYALGTLAAVMVIWLAWFGARKRSYSGGRASMKAWLSAHVYAGLALIVVATLHTGFHFGWNIHTAAYVLMLLVIGSGIYGVIAYLRYPALITRNHGESNLAAWLAEIQELGEQALKLADGLGEDVHGRVVRSNERVRIGGNAWEQLRGRARRRTQAAWKAMSDSLDRRLREMRDAKPTTAAGPPIDSMSTVMFMADQLATGAAGRQKDADRVARLLDVLARRQHLLAQVERDIALHARMQVWLYLHVPLTFALLAALVSHVVAVFLYW